MGQGAHRVQYGVCGVHGGSVTGRQCPPAAGCVQLDDCGTRALLELQFSQVDTQEADWPGRRVCFSLFLANWTGKQELLQEAAGSGPFAGKGSGLMECFLSVGAGMVQRPPLLQCPVLTMDKGHLLILEPVLNLL